MAITDEMKDSVMYEGQVMYSLPKSNNPYSYEALVSKPDMMVTTVGENVPKDRPVLYIPNHKNILPISYKY